MPKRILHEPTKYLSISYEFPFLYDTKILFLVGLSFGPPFSPFSGYSCELNIMEDM